MTNSLLDSITTSTLFSWFHLVYFIWYCFLSVKIFIWIVKQKIESKWNLSKKVSFDALNLYLSDILAFICSCIFLARVLLCLCVRFCSIPVSAVRRLSFIIFGNDDETKISRKNERTSKQSCIGSSPARSNAVISFGLISLPFSLSNDLMFWTFPTSNLN